MANIDYDVTMENLNLILIKKVQPSTEQLRI